VFPALQFPGPGHRKWPDFSRSGHPDFEFSGIRDEQRMSKNSGARALQNEAVHGADIVFGAELYVEIGNPVAIGISHYIQV
jgi:hypothetical protein